MHYIRFLKPPVLSPLPHSQGWKVTAKITVTSDLGESFLLSDLSLLVTILEADESFSLRTAASFSWRAGSRHLDITTLLTESSQRRAVTNVKWPCRMMIHAANREDYHFKLESAIHAPDKDSEDGGEDLKLRGDVLSIISEPIQPLQPKGTLKIVERSFGLGKQSRMSIWEETGESIARHIWDAGLLLSSYIHGLRYGFPSYIPKIIYKLPQLLSKPSLRVLELGAGVGIVGITLSRCYPQSSVIVSDLPEAEEIATYNIVCNKKQAVASGDSMDVKYQNIDWEQLLPENLRQGDLDLIVIADCTYNPDVVPDLVKTLEEVVKFNPGVMILLAMKVRHESEKIFFDLMKEKKMEIADTAMLALPILEEEMQEIEVYFFEGKN